MHRHVLVSLAPGQLCHLSPLPVSPPPPPSQSAQHLLSLCVCHPRGILEAGTRQPLPLSLLLLHTPLFSRPSFRAHFATEFSKGSRWHLALLSLTEPGQKTKKRSERNKKLPQIWMYSLAYPVWSPLFLLCPQAWREGVLVVVVVVDSHASSSSGWQKHTTGKPWNFLHLLLLTGPWYVSNAH